jgi:hypothetical protein
MIHSIVGCITWERVQGNCQPALNLLPSQVEATEELSCSDGALIRLCQSSGALTEPDEP